MKDIFISCERVDLPHAVALIQRLWQQGFSVSHSPRNPSDGNDERWINWYDGTGQSEIATSNIFIVVVTPGWDCATWMGFEAEEARKGLRQGYIRRMLHYNPTHTAIHYLENKQQWLGERLPDDLEEAIAVLESIKNEP